MVEYRTSGHAIFDLKYHVVLITKYRYKILRGRVAERARGLIRQSCEARGVTIERGAIYQIVRGYGVDAHMGVAPHDMRRSFARLAMRGGAPLDQIQATLGHESLRTTELYLGLELDLAHPACDFIRLDETANSQEKM